MIDTEVLDKAINQLEKLCIEKNNEVHDWHIKRSKPNSKPMDMAQSRNFGRMAGELKAYTKAYNVFRKLRIDLEDKKKSRINKAIRKLSELDKPTTEK